MNKLKAQMIDLMNQVNQNWVDEIRSSIKAGKTPRSTELMNKFSKCMNDLDTSFKDAEDRLKQ